MHYVWLLWSLLILAMWLLIRFSLHSEESRREMFIVSLWTSLLGVTEPFFVPAYWNPPSLFNLAARTGFDIESFIFSFAIGGLAIVIYEWLFPSSHYKIPLEERESHHHRYHYWTLISAPLIFILLLIFNRFNPIYSAFIALMVGGLSALYCRPDLKKKMITSAFLFLIIYFIFFLTLTIVYPNYVRQVWNFSEISGILILGVPFEELMFAFGFGFMWSSAYGHIKWYRIKK